ncbi:MAG: hypothetical protein A2Y90_01055 [Chloroflexi bacterium RBG_13_52_12]|nr:MAG: hypothetical protein A2Y90_01055 [Chloroflexi bacterium RBG_13_52_12]
MKKNISNARPVPQRTCAVCRQVKGKREMVRLVRTSGGGVEIDISGKKEGRGAYLCRDWACWEKLLKGKQLEHAFKSDIKRGDLEQLLKIGKDLLKE